jgi:hypothetical protein
MATRNWDELTKRHQAFWRSSQVDRPLIQVTYNYYVDTELVASVMGEGELTPGAIEAKPILAEYDKVAAARELVGDDAIAVAEPLLGIPWLEAICGCRVLVPAGKSLWPEPPANKADINQLSFSADNPWFLKLLEVIQTIVDHAGGRYAIGLSHLRGPIDILVALLGSERFFTAFFDEPDLVTRLARQAAEVWLAVAQAQKRIIPAYRGGYGVRQFGLWAPEPAAWLQDDTSGMISLEHYCQFFLEPMHKISVFPYGVLHLHAPSLHLAETLAQVPNVRTINFYFDSKRITLQSALPTLQRLQARKMPLVLAKDVYEGFSLEEYEEIIDGLSPSGLSVHLKADTLEEGQAVMAYVRDRARHQ